VTSKLREGWPVLCAGRRIRIILRRASGISFVLGAARRHYRRDRLASFLPRAALNATYWYGSAKPAVLAWRAAACAALPTLPASAKASPLRLHILRTAGGINKSSELAHPHIRLGSLCTDMANRRLYAFILNPAR